MTNNKDNFVDDNKEVDVIDDNIITHTELLKDNNVLKKKDKSPKEIKEIKEIKKTEKNKTPEEIAEMSNKRKQYHIEYFEKNKNKLKEKIKCPECGQEYMKYNKTSHIITKAHQTGLLVSKLTSEINALKNDSLTK